MVNGMEIELRDRAVERQPLMEGDSKVCFLIKSQLNFQFTERGFFFFVTHMKSTGGGTGQLSL